MSEPMTKAQRFLRDGLCLAAIIGGIAILFGATFWVIMNPGLDWPAAYRSMFVMAVGGTMAIGGILGLFV